MNPSTLFVFKKVVFKKVLDWQKIRASVYNDKASMDNKTIPTKPKPNSLFNHALYGYL